jgi:hypothetical protein
MRKFNKVQIILTVLLLIFLKNQLFSQDSDRFGVNLIFSSSKQNIDNKEIDANSYEKYETEYLYGFGIGIFKEFYIKENAALCFNIEYVQRGTEVYFPINDGMDEHAVNAIKTFTRLDNISIPIYAKVYLFKNDFRPFIIAGMQMDFMFSYSSAYQDDYYKKSRVFVYGANFGAGCEVNITKHITLLPVIRYSMDFNDILDYNYNSVYRFNVRGKAMDLLIGLSLR